MIRKIIDMLSGAVILASTIAVIPVAICNPYGLPFCIWVIAIFLSGLWQLFRYQTDDGPLVKNAPTERQLRSGAKKKNFNIILAENKEKVNETL